MGQANPETAPTNPPPEDDLDTQRADWEGMAPPPPPEDKEDEELKEDLADDIKKGSTPG